MYIFNNVSGIFAFLWELLEKRLNISLKECTYISQCTYLGLGLLEAPREHALHGPLLGIYWLRLCPHFGAPTLEAMLLWRGLFIDLMTAAHISPNVLSLQLSLASMYWTSYHIYSNARIRIIHYIHTSHIILHYITWYTHVHLASSFLLFFLAGWLFSACNIRYSYKKSSVKKCSCYKVSMLHTGILRSIKHLQPMDSNFLWSQGYSKYEIMVAVGGLGRWCH